MRVIFVQNDIITHRRITLYLQKQSCFAEIEKKTKQKFQTTTIRLALRRRSCGMRNARIGRGTQNNGALLLHLEKN